MSSVEQAANANANEAIRAFNHATVASSAHNVADVYTAPGELAQLGHRLEQATRQLAGILETRQRNTTMHLAIEDTRYSTASDAIDAALNALGAAAHTGERFGLDLETAQSALTWIRDPLTTPGS